MLDDDYERHVPPHLRAAMDRLREPQRVWDIFRDDDTVAEMERFTAHKRPAVGAASTKLLALGDWVRGNDARKTFGKIACFIMEERGYRVAQTGVDTPTDPLFTKGSCYSISDTPGRDTEPGALIIRDVGQELIARLRLRAARNGRTIEAEARQILADSLASDLFEAGPNLAKAIHRRFAALGGIDELPPHPPVSTEPPPQV